MNLIRRRRAGNALLIVGIGLVLLGILALGSSRTLGGFLYFALPVGFIIVAVSLVTRPRQREKPSGRYERPLRRGPRPQRGQVPHGARGTTQP